MAQSISVPTRFIAPTAPSGRAPAARPNISTAFSPPPWWLRVTTACSRCRRSSLPRTMEKQDCESRAARRWLAAHSPRYAGFDPVYLGDDLFSRQPICAAVRAVNGHFIFVCKPSSHPLIQQYITGIELAAHRQTVKRGKQRFSYTYRWIEAVPLRDSDDAMMVNWLELEIANARARSPIAVPSSPICPSMPIMLPPLPPPAAPGGRSRTRALMS